MENTYRDVRSILTIYPETRDDDRKLIAQMWFRENEDVTGFQQFLGAFMNGKFTNPDTITRCRRKVQEMHPELRGAKYAERQRRGGELRTEIKDLGKSGLVVDAKRVHDYTPKVVNE